MNIKVKNCDGCGRLFRRPGEALVMGIESDGSPEVIYHLCGRCAVYLATAGKDDEINQRIEAAAMKRQRGVLAA
jgi:hypothetical protein